MSHDMQRKCKICGAPAGLGMGDPSGKETWIAVACDEHRAEVERRWLQWCHDNGRRILPREYRHQDNRRIDFGQVTQGDKPEPARPVSAPAPEPSQGSLF